MEEHDTDERCPNSPRKIKSQKMWSTCEGTDERACSGEPLILTIASERGLVSQYNTTVCVGVWVCGAPSEQPFISMSVSE